MEKETKKLFGMAKGQERESRKEQGFFDGRFRPRSIPDKKKEGNRRMARKKGGYDE